MLELSARGSLRKPLTAQLALAPLCGLLAICVFFLFVTARFDVLMALPSVPLWPSQDRAGAPRPPALRVDLDTQGFTLRVERGDPMRIPRRARALDLGALCTNVRRTLEYHPDIRVVRLVPYDGIAFGELVASYDTLLAPGCGP